MDDMWKHRVDGMKCKTCMWFVPKQSGGRAAEMVCADGTQQALKPTYDLGRCRRHAPTISGFPAVFVNDWCGDHKLDENKI